MSVRNKIKFIYCRQRRPYTALVRFQTFLSLHLKTLKSKKVKANFYRNKLSIFTDAKE